MAESPTNRRSSLTKRRGSVGLLDLDGGAKINSVERVLFFLEGIRGKYELSAPELTELEFVLGTIRRRELYGGASGNSSAAAPLGNNDNGYSSYSSDDDDGDEEVVVTESSDAAALTNTTAAGGNVAVLATTKPSAAMCPAVGTFSPTPPIAKAQLLGKSASSPLAAARKNMSAAS